MSKFGRKLKQPPPGFEYVEPTLNALDNELRERVNDPHEGLRKIESQWPVHQINWQRSRYIYDLYYTYNRISKEVYDYCITNKIVDAALIAKWKKPGYERLCSTYAINPRNYKFGTVSICRVPKNALPPGTEVEDPFTGCRGCASGNGGNIFGNKYGQYLAAIQVAREDRATRLATAAAAAAAEENEAGGFEHGVHGYSGGGAGDDDDEGGPQPLPPQQAQWHHQHQHQQAMRQHLGPVGAADGGSGDGPDVWASNDDDVELDESMIGHLSREAETEGRSAMRGLGASAGAGASSSPPGKRTKYQS